MRSYVRGGKIGMNDVIFDSGEKTTGKVCTDIMQVQYPEKYETLLSKYFNGDNDSWGSADKETIEKFVQEFYSHPGITVHSLEKSISASTGEEYYSVGVTD